MRISFLPLSAIFKMKSKIKKTLLNSLLPILAGAVLVAGIIYAWTEPQTIPPTPNAPAPINVSTNDQTFEGSKTLKMGSTGSNVLGINGALGVLGVFEAFSTAIFDGRVDLLNDSTLTGLMSNSDYWRIYNNNAGGDNNGAMVIETGDDYQEPIIFRQRRWDGPSRDLMAITGDGVGIGTNNPGQRLDVAGNIRQSYIHLTLVNSG